MNKKVNLIYWIFVSIGLSSVLFNIPVITTIGFLSIGIAIGLALSPFFGPHD